MGRGTVLIVDDEPAIRRVLSRLIQRLGAQVLEAGNGQHAVQLARRQTESLDLIVADISLPGLSGIDAVREIRQMRSSIAVIFLSSSLADFSPGELMAAGGVRTKLVEKPFDVPALSSLIRELLHTQDAN